MTDPTTDPTTDASTDAARERKGKRGVAWAIWIGVYPKPYFEILEKPVAQIVERVRPGYFERQAATPVTAVEQKEASLR